MFDGEQGFILESLGDHQVRFVQTETFKGFLVPLLWRSLDTNTHAGFKQMNQALKVEAEKPT